MFGIGHCQSASVPGALSWRRGDGAKRRNFLALTAGPSSWAQVDALAAGESLLSMFVSDGAGSASRGEEGAELAIQAAAYFLGKKLKEREFGLSAKQVNTFRTGSAWHKRD